MIALLDKTQIQAKMPAAPVTFTTESVQQTLRGVGEYMLSVADLKRTNRPFPVDPGNRLPLELGHGALGVIYALHRLHGEVPGEIMDWLLRQEFQPDRYPAGLYTGLSGVAWVLAELGQIDRALDAHRMAANHMHLFTAADLFNGTSGFGLGSLHLWQRTGRQQFLDQALRVGDYLLSTRREDHRGSYWPSPDGKIPVGYAYGASGIALFLLYLYLASGEERFVRVGRAALDFDLSCRVVESGLATFPELAENSTLLLPYWRAGSAGVATTMLRYMQVAGNEDLLTIFDQVLPDVCRKYTVSPGLFTGLSGLGNLLLDCHQVTGDTRYLREAHRTAEGILLYKLERPSGVAFPGDHLYRISVDYGHGSAGVGLFLHRLRHGGPNFNLLLDSLIPARVPAHV